MKVLYYDCFCGISGDMNLGALLDLGVDEDYLRQELSKLDLDSEYELYIKKDSKNGINGTRVDVILNNTLHIHRHEHHQYHEVQTGTVMESHDGHAHRNLRDIENIIINSNLSDRVKGHWMYLKVPIPCPKVRTKQYSMLTR